MTLRVQGRMVCDGCGNQLYAALTNDDGIVAMLFSLADEHGWDASAFGDHYCSTCRRERAARGEPSQEDV